MTLSSVSHYMSLTIWCNSKFDEAATRQLEQGLAEMGHRLVWAAEASASVLAAGGVDPTLAKAEVALGQPDALQCLECDRLQWVEVTTAGYTRFDRPEVLETFRQRGVIFSNMSSVFAEPCAQHVLAMMLALSRELLPSYRDQLTDQRWEYFQRRYDSQLLAGQSVLILSFGAIARRLVELLAPFRMKVYALRRRTYSEPGVHIIAEERLSAVLPTMDHVVNILPDNDATRNFVNARRLAMFKPRARFYNIGRGTTVDQRALQEALESGRLESAYLDVTDPEPLPPEHPLWRTRGCYITPHTGGGRRDQDEAIVKHFLNNLRAFGQGEPLVDRVV
jgi:phosphoglycerate dehydrogenase-like enzyme